MSISKAVLLLSLTCVSIANAATPNIKLSADKSSVKTENDAVKYSLSMSYEDILRYDRLFSGPGRSHWIVFWG